MSPTARAIVRDSINHINTEHNSCVLCFHHCPTQRAESTRIERMCQEAIAGTPLLDIEIELLHQRAHRLHVTTSWAARWASIQESRYVSIQLLGVTRNPLSCQCQQHVHRFYVRSARLLSGARIYVVHQAHRSVRRCRVVATDGVEQLWMLNAEGDEEAEETEPLWRDQETHGAGTLDLPQ